MKHTFVSIGHKLERFEQSWLDVYLKRLKNFCTPEHRLIKDALPKFSSTQDPAYGTWLASKLPEHALLVALDISGKTLSTEKLSQRVSDWEMTHKEVLWVIGGAYGLPPSIIDQAQLTLSLGAMTLPHKIALLVLVEQVYRAYTIQKNIPYHHA